MSVTDALSPVPCRPSWLRAPRGRRSIRRATRLYLSAASCRRRRAGDRFACWERRLRPAPGRRDDDPRGSCPPASRRQQQIACVALAEVADRSSGFKGHVHDAPERPVSLRQARPTRGGGRCASADFGDHDERSVRLSVRNSTCCPFYGCRRARSLSIRRPTSRHSRVRPRDRIRRRCRARSAVARRLLRHRLLVRRSSTTSAFGAPRDGAARLPAARGGRGVDVAAQRARRRSEFVPVAEISRGRRRGRSRVPSHRQPPQSGAKARLKGAIDKIDPRRFCRVPHRARDDPQRGRRAARYWRNPRRRPAAHHSAQVSSVEPGRRMGRRQRAHAEAGRILGRRDPPRARRHHVGAAARGGRARAAVRRRRGPPRERAEPRAPLRADGAPARAASRARAHRAREIRRQHARRRHELPRRLELQARGDRHRLRPRRLCSPSSSICRPDLGRRGARPRHQGLGLPARLRPVPTFRHRLSGRIRKTPPANRRRSISSTSAAASHPITPGTLAAWIGKVPARTRGRDPRAPAHPYIANHGNGHGFRPR